MRVFVEVTPQKVLNFNSSINQATAMKTGIKEVSKPITPAPFNPIHRDLIIVFVTSLGVAVLLVCVIVFALG